MFSIGLNLKESARTSEALVDPYLLSGRFSYSGFLKYIFCCLGSVAKSLVSKNCQPCSLFPDLAHLTILAINNSLHTGPVVCAADDLELSLTGGPGQIEFFDNYFSASSASLRDRFNSNPEGFSGPFDTHAPVVSANGSAGNFDMPAFQDFSPTASLSLQQPLSLLSSFHYEHPSDSSYGVKQQLPFVQIHSQPILQNYSPENGAQAHFALNMIDPQQHPYFNDFKHSVNGPDGASMYGSSLDTYASPLDEMFFKKPSAEMRPSIVESTITMEDDPGSRKRKRKGSSSLSSEHHFYYEMLYDRKDVPCDNSELELPCTMKLELPCNMKFESLKKFKRESVADSVASGEDYDRSDLKFICNQCDAAFKVKSYLTRHMRKHNNAKAFVCPFFEETESDDGRSVAKNGTKCHPTGGFSRRDTYKTHLKALHFIYPPGTKSSERNSIGGRCAGCFEFFESNAQWLKLHIEVGGCKGTVGNGEVKVKQETN